jgi:hypothetical protein
MLNISEYSRSSGAHAVRIRLGTPLREGDTGEMGELVSRANLLDGTLGTCVRVLMALSALSLLAFEAQPQLAIVGAGVEQAEDGPFVSSDFTFLPGDYVYFSFQVSGFKTSGGDYAAGRKLALTYQVALLDQTGSILEQQEVDRIGEELTREDKNWAPKRRASFLLPPFIAAGTFGVRLTVHDEYGKTDVSRDFPFHVGGRQIEPASSLSIQNFRFLRDERDGHALESPDYRAGATVWGRFDMTGFKTGAKNSVHLQYGVSVLRPDGSVIFTQPEAANESMDSDYHPQFVPGVLSVTTTPSLARGEYTMVVSVHDLLGKQDQTSNYKFRIE